MCDALESKNCQQLDRCLAATVWASRHHSNIHHSLSPWMHENQTSAPELGDTDWNRHAGTRLSEIIERRQWVEAASDWNVVSNQQSYIDQATDQWQDCFNACLKAKSKHWTSAMMFLCNCHGIRHCCYKQIDLCFVSQGKVRTAIRRGGQFCCKFTSVFVCQKLSKYSAVWRSYCKNKGCNFFAPQSSNSNKSKTTTIPNQISTV